MKKGKIRNLKYMSVQEEGFDIVCLNWIIPGPNDQAQKAISITLPSAQIN